VKRYLIILLIGVAGNLQAQTPSESIQFEERVHNFGSIQEKNGKVSHTFVFQNKGKTPVTIDDIHSTCGCIGKMVTQGAIKPGGKGKVTITFDPGYKSGFFSKEIVVLSNNKEQYNRIWVEGNIQPMDHPIEEDYPYNFGHGLYLRLKVMAFGYLSPGDTKQMELHYANATGQEMTLQFAPEVNRVGLKFTNPGKLKPGQRGVIKVEYTMPQGNGNQVLLKLFPVVNGVKLKETVDLRILKGKN
jgi:hypothetical protein